MSENLYLISLFVIAGTAILAFAMRYLALRQSARTRTAREEAYRSLAASTAALQSETNARLSALQTEIANISGRIGNIETLLRDVG